MIRNSWASLRDWKKKLTSPFWLPPLADVISVSLYGIVHSNLPMFGISGSMAFAKRFRVKSTINLPTKISTAYNLILTRVFEVTPLQPFKDVSVFHSICPLSVNGRCTPEEKKGLLSTHQYCAAKLRLKPTCSNLSFESKAISCQYTTRRTVDRSTCQIVATTQRCLLITRLSFAAGWPSVRRSWCRRSKATTANADNWRDTKRAALAFHTLIALLVYMKRRFDTIAVVFETLSQPRLRQRSRNDNNSRHRRIIDCFCFDIDNERIWCFSSFSRQSYR